MDGKAVRVGPVCSKVWVEGVVQGVGYREFARRSATRLGISGWVRNRNNGAVEALVQGAAANIEALLAEMRRGPPGSEVAHLRLAECEGNEAEIIGGFVVRPTR
ncbi:acylphosphatase [uncultured Rhodoblastus sp.]|uniref:acylphosphatase n=1 Tax=uncultured Rhodoblastus sp. TaxID=543037 RepID=UPI0025EDCCCB|nr:acylphosphatase [uncultured Rhodoblastus sp.]